MEILLLAQITYNQLTSQAYQRMAQLMRNPNPASEMKRVTEGDIRGILGEPKNCTENQATKTCIWTENSRSIEVVFNLINRNTISRWTSRGF